MIDRSLEPGSPYNLVVLSLMASVSDGPQFDQGMAQLRDEFEGSGIPDNEDTRTALLRGYLLGMKAANPTTPLLTSARYSSSVLYYCARDDAVPLSDMPEINDPDEDRP